MVSYQLSSSTDLLDDKGRRKVYKQVPDVQYTELVCDMFLHC